MTSGRRRRKTRRRRRRRKMTQVEEEAFPFLRTLRRTWVSWSATVKTEYTSRLRLFVKDAVVTDTKGGSVVEHVVVLQAGQTLGTWGAL